MFFKIKVNICRLSMDCTAPTIDCSVRLINRAYRS